MRANQLECNWLQTIEGDIDTTHVGFLHYGGLKPEDQPPGSFSEYQLRTKPAHFEVIDTEGGAAYGARRPAGDGQYYWRIAQWCFPFYTFTPPGVLGLVKGNGARVPMDDTHTMVYFMMSGRRGPLAHRTRGQARAARSRRARSRSSKACRTRATGTAASATANLAQRFSH